MAKTVGFGTVKGLLNSNRPMIVVELNFQVAARIESISCGFVEPLTSVVPLTDFQYAMCGVYKGPLDVETTYAPQVQSVDAWLAAGGPVAVDGPLSLTNPLWEARWSIAGDPTTSSGRMDRHFTFPGGGLPLNANQIYSVILPLPATNSQPAPQNVADLIGVLSVHGRQDQGAEVYGEMR